MPFHSTHLNGAIADRTGGQRQPQPASLQRQHEAVPHRARLSPLPRASPARCLARRAARRSLSGIRVSVRAARRFIAATTTRRVIPLVVGRHDEPRRVAVSRSPGSRPRRPPCNRPSGRAPQVVTQNFQFFSGSSSRSRKRRFCSSFETMQEELQDHACRSASGGARTRDVLVAAASRCACVTSCCGRCCAVEDLRMDAHDEHFLVVASD